MEARVGHTTRAFYLLRTPLYNGAIDDFQLKNTMGSLRRAILILFTLIALTLPAIQPLLRGQMPLTADGTLHLYRLVALDHTLSDGTLWARYVPGLAYGYGAPMFNYYSPLSLYPMLVIHQLGMSFLESWLGGMTLYVLAAAIGAYLFGKAWSGEVGGIIAAAGYLYAPYMLYDSLWRGTTAELASLALLPYVLWSLTNLARSGHRRDWLLTVLAFALFIPMHNVITLHGAVLVGMYALFLWMIKSGAQDAAPLQRGVKLFSPLILGLALTAFFWLPALTETRYVKLDAITATNPTIDVIANLTDLGSVFALPMTAYPMQLQPPLSIALSWVQIVLAVIAIVLVFRNRAPSIVPLRSFVLLSLVLIALLVFMNTHASAVLWETLPLIRYSQFPSRLLGLASLLLAALAGIGVAQLIALIRSKSGQIAALVVSLSAVILYGFPYLYPIYLPDVNPQNIVDVQDFERDSGFITTSSFGEYLPIWNFEPPDSAKLTPHFEQSETISRLEPTQALTINSRSWGNTSGRLEIEAQAETTLTFNWFYFPGWTAALNGETLALAPTSPEGLISATVPPGSHTLEIWLANTERQSLAWLMSAFGLLAVMTGFALYRRVPSFLETPVNVDLNSARAAPRLLIAVLMIGITLFILKLGVIDRVDTPIRRENAAIEQPVNANLDNQIMLLGYDVSGAPFMPGGVMNFNLYWQLNGDEINTDYSSVVTLKDSSGIAYWQQTAYQPGGLATRHWLPGTYVQERVRLEIPLDTPPGSYSVSISLYDPVMTRSLDVINTAGNPDGFEVSIGTYELSRPMSGRPLSGEGIPFTPNLTLLEPVSMPDQAAVGQEFTFFWTWQLREIQADSIARLAWLQDGEVSAESPELPLVTGFPLDSWQPGEIWRGGHRVYVPGDLESGRYEVAVEVEGVRQVVDTMTVIAPKRVYEPPDMTFTTDAVWENGIRLLGYDIDAENRLTFHWQTDQPINRNLSVFVHLVDEQDMIAAQSAAVPANYTRPTPGWAVGEIVTDTVSVAYDDDFEVRVGWFDPLSGVRVKLVEGAEYIMLR